MAGSKDKPSAPVTVELVSPNGEITRTVNVGSKEEVALRFDGFLPGEQAKLEAPKVEAPSAPKTVGSGA